MKIKWLGHACMLISENGWTAVCDPFKPGTVPGLSPVSEKADAVFCSHGHDDHNYKDAVTIEESGAYPMKVTAVSSWHDNAEGTLRGYNIIHVLEADSGMRAVHLGDLGYCISEEEAKEYAKPDVLMIPVGGFYTIDAKEAKVCCDNLKPRVIIPMHYRSDTFGYDVIGTVDEFLKLFDPKDIVRYDTDTIEIDENTPPHVAVLKYMG